MNQFKVGYLQFAPTFGDIRGNVSTVKKALKEVDADLIVLPELPFTGYYFENRAELLSLAEDPIKSPTISALTELCQNRNLSIVTGFAEKCGDGPTAKVFNSALLINGDGLAHTYRKLHLFNTEKEYFDPGDVPLQVVEVKGKNSTAKIGMMVCFDWLFPEVARTLTLKGAEVICHPSNLVLNLCQQAMITRSIENYVYFITANRHGKDTRPRGYISFPGESQIVGPKGSPLYKGPANEDHLYVTEIDLSRAHDKHIAQLNDLVKDRRPEFYELGCSRGLAK